MNKDYEAELLQSLPPEELEKVVPLSEEQIEQLLDEGKKERDATLSSGATLSANPRVLFR